MAQWTNRGKIKLMKSIFRTDALPTNYQAALATAATAPTAATNTFGQLTQIATGFGYGDGGIALTKNNVDFPGSFEDDVLNLGRIDIKDLIWTANGGPIPASGVGAQWGVLTDAASPVSAREVIAFSDLIAPQSVVDGQPLRLNTWRLQFRFNRGITNRGAYNMVRWMFEGAAIPTQFNLHLVTAATAPTATTDTLGQLTRIANGNGWTDGLIIARNSTDFPITRDLEDDTGNTGKMGIKPIVIAASGGPLPSDSVGARYAVLCDNNVTLNSREVFFFWDLNNPIVVSSGESITLDPLNLTAIE